VGGACGEMGGACIGPDCSDRDAGGGVGFEGVADDVGGATEPASNN
jgi:hypothetical protein